jgi:rhodanese-related sulfurtransferase
MNNQKNQISSPEKTLSESPIFKGIPKNKLAEIAGSMQKRVVPAHSIIFQQRDAGDNFYMIESGRVRIFRKSRKGLETDLSVLKAGDSFGEMALITAAPRSASVESMEETHLAVLSKNDFERILKDYPDVALNFAKQLSGWLLRRDLAAEREALRQFQAPRLSWIDFIAILGLTLLCGIQLVPRLESDGSLTEILPALALEKHLLGETLFIDARPANFFDQRHLKDAVNLPLSLFDITYLMTLNDADKSKEIIIYGRTLSNLYDSQVARKLIIRGHKNVKILKGGLHEWVKNGYPTQP